MLNAANPEDQLLLSAVYKNNLLYVEEQLNHGISANFYFDSVFIGKRLFWGKDGKKEIFWPGGPLLCGARSVAMAQLLLNYGANINGIGGKCALNSIIQRGDSVVVLYLIREGAWVNIVDRSRMSPLAVAIKNNFPEIVEALIQHKALFKFLFIHGECMLTKEDFERFFNNEDIRYYDINWRKVHDAEDNTLWDTAVKAQASEELIEFLSQK